MYMFFCFYSAVLAFFCLFSICVFIPGCFLRFLFSFAFFWLFFFLHFFLGGRSPSGTYVYNLLLDNYATLAWFEIPPDFSFH